MEQFIDQYATHALQCATYFSRLCGPTGPIGPISSKYFNIFDEEKQCLLNLSSEQMRDAKIYHAWLQVKHLCQFCRQTKARRELNVSIELHQNSPTRFILFQHSMQGSMNTHPTGERYREEICIECSNQCANQLQICQDAFWSIGPKGMELMFTKRNCHLSNINQITNLPCEINDLVLQYYRQASLPTAIWNIIMEFANPRFYHIQHCALIKNKRKNNERQSKRH